MLKNIYYKRYGKILIAVGLLIVAIYGLGSWDSQKSWHSSYKYYHSEEFLSQYDLHPEAYTRYDNEKGSPVPFESRQAYVDQQLVVFNQSDDEFTWHYQPFIISFGTAVLVLFFLIGFLLFFVDQKTHFNRFLFGLPFTRNELFRKKIQYLAAPLVAFALLGVLVNICLFYFSIPKPYMNIELSQFLWSGVGTFVLNLFALCGGIFCGVLFGNLVFGPLSIGLIAFFLTWSPYFVNNLQKLYAYFNGRPNGLLQTYWNNWPGAETTPWYAMILIVAAGILLLFAASKIFQKISLENDGDYLTVPEIRLPIFLILSFGSWFYFEVVFDFISANLLGYSSLFWTIFSMTVLFIFCTSISFLLIYFRVIKKWWYERKMAKVHRVSSN